MSEIHELVVTSGSSITTAFEVEIPAPSGCKIRLKKLKLGQINREGDANSEMLLCTFTTGVTTSGTHSTTPSSKPRGNRAATITCAVNNATYATAGTVREYTVFHNQAGVLEEWNEEASQVVTDTAGILSIKVEAPGSASWWYGTVIFEVVV
jgi:hypothetical protein